jgi:hypothetical protein
MRRSRGEFVHAVAALSCSFRAPTGVPAPVQAKKKRTDRDRNGLRNRVEVKRFHPNWCREDTDRDGIPNGEDIKQGASPTTLNASLRCSSPRPGCRAGSKPRGRGPFGP